MCNASSVFEMNENASLYSKHLNLFLIQGHRAYVGHKKYITPNKRQMLHYFLNSTLSEREFKRIVKELHRDSLGQPEIRASKGGRDVIAYPVPECMCNNVSIGARHVLQA